MPAGIILAIPFSLTPESAVRVTQAGLRKPRVCPSTLQAKFDLASKADQSEQARNMTISSSPLSASIELAVQNSFGSAATSLTGNATQTLTEKAVNQSTVFDEVMNNTAITDAFVDRGGTTAAGPQNLAQTMIDQVIEVLSNASGTVMANSDIGGLDDLLDSIRDPDIDIVDIADPGGTGDLTVVGESQIGQAEAAILDHLINMSSPGAPPQTMTPAEQNMAPGSQGYSTYQYGNTTTVVDNLTGDSVTSSVQGEGINQTSTTTISRPDLPGVAASPTTNTTTVTTQNGTAVTTQSITTPTGMTINTGTTSNSNSDYDTSSASSASSTTGGSGTTDSNCSTASSSSTNSNQNSDYDSNNSSGSSSSSSSSSSDSDESGECTF